MQNFNIGDKVIRVNDPKVGTILELSGNRAYILWANNWQRVGGSYADTCTWIAMSSLLPATAENIASVKEKVQPTAITAELKRTLNLWIELVGTETHTRPFDVFRHLLESKQQALYTRHTRNAAKLIKLGYLVADRTDVGTAFRLYRVNVEMMAAAA